MRTPRFKKDMGGVTSLLASLRTLQHGKIQIGIFGNKDARGEAVTSPKGNRIASKQHASVTNAEVGAKNEFGSYAEGIPPRPFLNMPLRTHQKDLESFAKRDVAAGLGSANPMLLMKRLGGAAERLIAEAFKTSGWGSWKANAPYTVHMKGSAKPLIDTNQLRHAIASRVIA